MRRSITAVTSVVVALAAAGCAGGGGGTTLASTTTTSVVTTVPAVTTTEAPSTTAAETTTTTTLITDATTADPKALVAQLQAVLDRYDDLTVESLADPDLPFVDERFIEELRGVAETDVMAGLVQRWQQLREQGIAGRLGPSGRHRQVLNSLAEVSADSVNATYCMYDDGVTFERSSGRTIDDGVVLRRGVVDFVAKDARWTISHKETVEESRLAPGDPNPCPNEQIG